MHKPIPRRKPGYTWDTIDASSFAEGEAIRKMIEFRPKVVKKNSKIKFGSRDGLANKLIKRRFGGKRITLSRIGEDKIC